MKREEKRRRKRIQFQKPSKSDFKFGRMFPCTMCTCGKKGRDGKKNERRREASDREGKK